MTALSGDRKIDYIFGKASGRFDWITNGLLGDMKIFLDGVSNNKGGGNHSVPILISTALEFLSALYAGETKYGGKTSTNSYNASSNVEKFVKNFF